MTRTMGDATHDAVPQLAAAGTDLVAGYVTGGPGIVWTAADWAMFPSVPHVTIDQGFTGSPVPDAIVRDVEAGAWGVIDAVNRTFWTALRPTIYCSVSLLGALAQAGWQGDVWVAEWIGVAPIRPPVVPAGMTCVAWQWTDQGGGGAYDLSAVFDPTWPTTTDPPQMQQEDPMSFIVWGATDPATKIQKAYLVQGGRTHWIQDIDALNLYHAAGIPVAGAPGAGISAAEETALLADYPAGQPAVTVTVPPVTVAFPTFTTTPNPA